MEMDKENRKRFVRGGILLSLTAVAMRAISIAFNSYITGKIGAEGMGLITLVGSVYGFAVTFATSGISLSATRMVAEAMGRGSSREVRAAMRRCIFYSLAFGITAMLLMLALAAPIGKGLLGDGDTVLALRVLAPALPFISLSAALSGYFTAVRRVHKAAAKTVFEQGLKIALTVIGLRWLLPLGMRYACAAVVGGTALAEGGSLLLAWLLYTRDLRKHIGNRGSVPPHLTNALLSIALPVAFTAYARSGLVTVEHLLIPRGLRLFGADGGEALAAYGEVQSMALPVVLFPLAILVSFTGLLIPAFAEAKARAAQGEIDTLASRALENTLLFSSGSAVITAVFHRELGQALFPDNDAGRFIFAFSLLIPVMYFDSTVDAILKGMGEQVYSMKVNILDAALSALLVALVLPFTGIWGYVVIIGLTEWLNMLLSLRRARRICRITVAFDRYLLLPTALSLLSALPFRYLQAILQDSVSPIFALFICIFGSIFAMFLLWKGVGLLFFKKCAILRS